MTAAELAPTPGDTPKSATKAGEKAATKAGEKGAVKAGEKVAAKGVAKVGAKAVGKSLLKKIPGVGLVAGGVLEKRLYTAKPQRYEYHLTAKGRELIPILQDLERWGKRHN